jgi:hypothetical protein
VKDSSYDVESAIVDNAENDLEFLVYESDAICPKDE